MAELIHADEVVFQDLEDLKAACMEAASDETKVTDFEVGVFSGRYQTPVPRRYFEQGRRASKIDMLPYGAATNGDGPANATLVASCSPSTVSRVETRNGMVD